MSKTQSCKSWRDLSFVHNTAPTVAATSHKEREFEEYMKQHNLSQIFDDILTTLYHYRFPDPIPYIVKYTFSIQNQIKLLQHKSQPLVPNPQPHHIVCYNQPQIVAPQPNILLQCLKPQYFKAYKQSNSLGGSFRDIIKVGLDNPLDKVGVWANDGYAYTNYYQFFNEVQTLILQDDILIGVFKYQDNYDMPVDQTLHWPFISQTRVTVHRNIATKRFNNSIQFDAERNQIKNEIRNALEQKNIKIIKELNLEEVNLSDYDKVLCTQFDLPKSCIFRRKLGLRGKDWPQGRHLLQLQQKYLAFFIIIRQLVFINHEDHLKILDFGQKDENPLLILQKVLKTANSLDLLYAHDPKQGYLTTKPQKVGLGVGFSMNLEVPNEFVETSKNNIQNYRKQNKDAQWFAFSYKNKNCITIKLRTCLALTFKSFSDKLVLLMQKILGDLLYSLEVKRPLEVKFEYRESIYMDDLEEQEVNSADSMSQSVKFSQAKRRTDHSLLPSMVMIAMTPLRGRENSVFGSASDIGKMIKMSYAMSKKWYELHEDELEEMYNENNEKKFYDICDICSGAKQDVYYQNSGMIKQIYFFIRRNVGLLPFKPEMCLEDYERIDKIFDQFITQIPMEYLGVKCKYDDNQELYKKLLEEYISDQCIKDELGVAEIAYQQQFNKKTVDYPTGYSIYVSAKARLIIISCLSDHFIIKYIVDPSQPSLTQCLIKIEDMLQKIEGICQGFSFNPKFGILTVHPINSGSGVSVNALVNKEQPDLDDGEVCEVGNGNMYKIMITIKTLLISKLIHINRGSFDKISNGNLSPMGLELFCNYLCSLKAPCVFEQFHKYTQNMFETCEFHTCQSGFQFQDSYSIIHQKLLVYDFQAYKLYKECYKRILFELKYPFLNDYWCDKKDLNNSIGVFKNLTFDGSVSITLIRNFKQIHFCKFLNPCEKNKLVERLNMEIYKLKLFDSNLKHKRLKYFITQLYKVSLRLNIVTEDHIQIDANCQPQELHDYLFECYKLIEMMGRMFQIQYDPDLGFLSPLFEAYILDAIQFKIILNQPLGDCNDLLGQYRYQESQVEKQYHIKTLDRPSVLKYEGEFIQQLNKLLQ